MKKNLSVLLSLIVILSMALSACGAAPAASVASVQVPQSTGEPVEPAVEAINIPTPETLIAAATAASTTEGAVTVYPLKGSKTITPEGLQLKLQDGTWVIMAWVAAENPQVLAACVAAAVAIVAIGTVWYIVTESGAQVPSIPSSIIDPAALLIARTAPAFVEATLLAQLEQAIPAGVVMTSAYLLVAGNTCQSSYDFKVTLSDGLKLFSGNKQGICLPETNIGALRQVLDSMTEMRNQLATKGEAFAADVTKLDEAINFVAKVIDFLSKLSKLGGL